MIRPSDYWIRREKRRRLTLKLQRTAEIIFFSAMIAVIIWRAEA